MVKGMDMNIKANFKTAKSKANEIKESETFKNLVSTTKDLCISILKMDGVKQILTAAGAGALIGFIVPLIPVSLAAATGAVLGAYKFIVK
jgi:hypothetical protein